MTECRDSDGAPVDTTDDISGAIDRVLGAENSNNSQIVSLKALSLESVSNGDSEAPLPLRGDNAQKTKPKNKKKIKRKPKRPPQAKGPPTQVASRAVPALVLDWPPQGQTKGPQSFPPPQKGPGKMQSWSLTRVAAPLLNFMPVGCQTSHKMRTLSITLSRDTMGNGNMGHGPAQQ